MSMKHRKRQIDGGFWLSERIAELSPLAQLTYIGLWNVSDREGRLENRPKLIEAHLSPHKKRNLPPLLQELEAGGFIYFYDERKYIHVVNLVEHQRIHPHEAASKLPDPDMFVVDGAPAAPVKPKAKTKSTLEVSPERLKEIYHEACPSLQRIKVLEHGTKRYSTFFRRLEASQKKNPGKVEKAWLNIFKKVERSDFLTARIRAEGKFKNWKCTLDWIVEPDNMVNIYEGKYDNDTGMTPAEENAHFAKSEAERARRGTSEPVSMGDAIGNIIKRAEPNEE